MKQSEIIDFRLEKIINWREGESLYKTKFVKSHEISEIINFVDSDTEINIAGRLTLFRKMGKLSFGHISNYFAQIQIALNKNELKQEYKRILDHLDIGDIIGVTGNLFTTKKGEKTINVKNLEILVKSLRPLPNKWHGIEDFELKARQRYLDLLMNQDTRLRFDKKKQIIQFIRKYLDNHDFYEVHTPLLQFAASGASARPFITHHNALNIPLFLRIAPETYLKRLMVAGYQKIYELGKCFRNESIDASHLQEFLMLEYYVAFWDYENNLKFTIEFLKKIIESVNGELIVKYDDKIIDFSGQWKRISFFDLILQDTGINLAIIKNMDDLIDKIKIKKLEMDLENYFSLAGLMDGLYKKFSRPNLIQPTIVSEQPSELVPLARKSDKNQNQLEMFQIIANGWELVKAYSELIDPIEQRKRFEGQMEAKERGDQEAMMLEEDYIICMEYGMPPMSGLGLGIDRFSMLLTNSKSIRDVILFPSLKPISQREIDDVFEKLD